MIVDTSAVLAIMLDEDDARAYAEALAAAPGASMSAASYLEAGLVVDANKDPVLSRRLDEVLTVGNITVVSVTPEHAAVARQAHRDYGRGSGHPAGLNFGDCFSYALAHTTREPLLFKGDDFAHTDLERALR